jgi:plasmid maintenance system antidote protein VapI
MKKITQNIIAQALDVSQPFINQILVGQKPISWKMAEKLSDMFPGKSLREWKHASPKELKQAFNQLPEKETV